MHKRTIAHRDTAYMLAAFGKRATVFGELRCWRRLFVARPPLTRFVVSEGILSIMGRKYVMCRMSRRHARRAGAMKGNYDAN